jgi:NTE family protein
MSARRNSHTTCLITFSCLLITLIGYTSLAQTARPKIGLVLSGGGAKGIAHVRVLQVLDSLGIVPDYIAGTSMGSVVGGLYAAGYTGHQIDSITKATPWDRMFSNSLTFDEINIEEKDEFGRYIYELPLKRLTPQFPLGVVEGQQIEELLASLFFPVNTITDFNKLPTPFLCVAADIIKGEPVILRKGSIAAAVRASMSIPTVFSPVRIDGRLLQLTLEEDYIKKRNSLLQRLCWFKLLFFRVISAIKKKEKKVTFLLMLLNISNIAPWILSMALL